MKLTDEQKQMISDCISKSDKLNQSQLNFIKSIKDAEHLSGRKIYYLMEIWASIK
ncbi:MAG TPA: hypothetical protein VGW78_07690 [Candidatus Babeliales bacterium]|jgi:hypothetical protein|nr:hypothetical protein [Candidatus Babeliales bacterium]